ncbi:MAG: hypothetical protein IJ344_03570 [Clostridia bacterium]|nr:hypothetical protein [Clostridia bacterium]
MKAEQLYEALGGVDSRFLFESEKKRSKKPFIVGGLCAVVALTLVVSMLLGVAAVARTLNLADPFRMGFVLGAAMTSAPPKGIDSTQTAKHGTLYYKAEGENTLTLILEKTSFKKMDIHLAFSLNHDKRGTPTSYGGDRVLFSTSPLVWLLCENSISDGVTILINGKKRSSIPRMKGKYEIVIDFSDLAAAGYGTPYKMRLSPFYLLEYGADDEVIEEDYLGASIAYTHGEDEQGRPAFTMEVGKLTDRSYTYTGFEKLYFNCTNFPLEKVIYEGKALPKEMIGGKSYYLLDLSSAQRPEITQYLRLVFKKDALKKGEWVRLEMPVYYNGSEEEHKRMLYLNVSNINDSDYVSPIIDYYDSLEDVPAGIRYPVPTVLPEVKDPYNPHFKLYSFERIRDYRNWEGRTVFVYGSGGAYYCTVTMNVTDSKENYDQVLVHNGITYYYRQEISISQRESLLYVYFMIDGENGRKIHCKILLAGSPLLGDLPWNNTEMTAEEFIKGIEIRENS